MNIIIIIIIITQTNNFPLNNWFSIVTFCYRLQHARNILCDEEQRKNYDYWRRSGVAVPYEQWTELSRAVHTSMHWAVKPRKQLMLRYRKGYFQINIPKLIRYDVK